AYGVWELGDRPTTLIAEIERVEAKDRQAVVSRDAGAQAKNSAGVAAPPPLNKQRAQALVAEARELEKKGRLLEARLKALQAAQRLAEELAADPSYGVQQEAMALIRSIDVEERNQGVLTADRTAQAAVEAFRQRNYRVAHNIMTTIDMRLLNPTMLGALREI